MVSQTRPWVLETGARPAEGGCVEFRVWAPQPSRIEVAFKASRSWERARMQAEGKGFFRAEADIPIGARYFFVLDGRRRRPDPASRYQPEGVHGPSEVVDPGEFEWTDERWRGVALNDLVLYEVHTGTYTGAGTFEAIEPHLGRLKDLGVTALELMPVAQFPGGRNWGYDGVDLYAVQDSYGGHAGLKSLIDACHSAGLALFLDVVYNHFGPEGNYLSEFGPYFSYKYTTPWGPAVNYDERGSDQVRRFVVDNALYWITEYHIDGLRLDAVQNIFDSSPRHILAQIGDEVRALGLERKVHLIAESDLNDPRVIDAREAGGYAMDAQWSDDFHHSVHAYLTGERSRYYEDFGSIEDVEKAIRSSFVFDGRYSEFRGRSYGAPAKGHDGDEFVVCIQNHDQVGNRADGARLATLLEPPKLRTAVGLLLLSPNIPLLFMGEEFGSRSPFYYFTSHLEPALVEAVRQGRRREFGDGGGRARFVDPQSKRTFEVSKVDHSLLKRKRNLEVFRYYKTLLDLRRAHPALGVAPGDVEVVRLGRAIAVRRRATEEECCVAYSLGDPAGEAGRYFPGEWSGIFASDPPTSRYGVSVWSKDEGGGRN